MRARTCIITKQLFYFFCYLTGDEAIISMSVAGEVTDASIMEVGRSRPQFQYSRVNVTLQMLLEFIKVA